MKRYLLILILISRILSGPATAQTGNIQIQGFIDSSVIRYFNTKELLIKVSNPVDKLLNQEEMIKVPLSTDGKFKVVLKSLSAFTYLSFWTIDHGKQRVSSGELYPIHFPARLDSELEENYLFQSGDSVRLFIGKEGYLSFKGKGAAKLNCQYQLYSLERLPKAVVYRKTDLRNTGHFQTALELQDTVLKLNTALRMNILESYKGQLNEVIYHKLYLDATGTAGHELVAPLWKETLVPDKNKETAVSALQLYYNKYLDGEIQKPFDTAVLQSTHYLAYLFEKEWNTCKLYGSNFENGDSFRGIYELLKQKYRGKLRDELLMICVRKLNSAFNSEIRSGIDDVILTVQDKKYKKALQQWKTKQYAAAYPFELEDTRGKIHKLADYKGKLLVIDFWFTGCSWCVNLNAAMHTIMEKYKNNPQVVFLSVCEDQKKAMWIKSLSGGEYTSAGTINLYTNGLGPQHPMLKHYNFQGAPRQLLIDQMGQVISSAPPRPDMGVVYESDANGNRRPDPVATLGNQHAQAFMKLIDEHLK